MLRCADAIALELTNWKLWARRARQRLPRPVLVSAHLPIHSLRNYHDLKDENEVVLSYAVLELLVREHWQLVFRAIARQLPGHT
jgi:hypothetical protein